MRALLLCPASPGPDHSSTPEGESCGRTGRPCGRPARRCGRTWGNRRTPEIVSENPCGTGVPARRTSPTQSLRGPRDRSGTTICTTAERLAGRGWRRPGDGVSGIGGAGWIDRERHRYRSSGGPPDSGLVPRSDGTPHRRALVAHTDEGPSPISSPVPSLSPVGLVAYFVRVAPTVAAMLGGHDTTAR